MFKRKQGALQSVGSWFWWIKIIVVGILSAFFLIFGIEVLIGAYSLKQPQVFIMYFFSGSFITLFSLVGILYPFFQIHAWITRRPNLPEDD